MDEKMTELAPPGTSAFDYRVELVNGGLVLHWGRNDEAKVQTFTNEETGNLLDFLYDRRHEILKHE